MGLVRILACAAIEAMAAVQAECSSTADSSLQLSLEEQQDTTALSGENTDGQDGQQSTWMGSSRGQVVWPHDEPPEEVENCCCYEGECEDQSTVNSARGTHFQHVEDPIPAWREHKKTSRPLCCTMTKNRGWNSCPKPGMFTAKRWQGKLYTEWQPYLRCQKARCPENSSRRVPPLREGEESTTRPRRTCVCDVGYTGQLAYDPKWNRWDGACALAACPANAQRPSVFVEDGTGHLCRCKYGYRGTLTWDDVLEGYRGRCRRIPPEEMPKPPPKPPPKPRPRWAPREPRAEEQPEQEPRKRAPRGPAEAAFEMGDFCRQCETLFSAYKLRLYWQMTDAELRKAFKAASLKLHPDRNYNATDSVRKLNEASFKVANHCAQDDKANYVTCCGTHITAECDALAVNYVEDD
jgi:hypothetical protein